MKIISRKGSQVIVEDRLGRIWLTRRTKRKKNCRRQKVTNKGWSIRYWPIKQLTYESIPSHPGRV